MPYLIAAVAGFAFGAGDQYLGSGWGLTTLGGWGAQVSGMSAPWLLLPFIFGCAQPRASRAAAIGLTATMAALLGYLAMTWSPLEGVHLAGPGAVPALAATQLHVILPGLVSGPLFGYLGWRWRTQRSWPSIALVAVAFCLEPLARLTVGQLDPPYGVWRIEVAAGLIAAAVLAAAATRERRRSLRA
jgi:hypothetical protein